MRSMVNETIGQRIRVLRHAEGLTLPELASAMGVTKSAVSQWESGCITNIRLDTFLLLTKFFGVTSHYLITGESDARA